MLYRIILILFYFYITFSSVFGKTYEIENDGEISVIISRHNPNRIKIINDRIKKINCNDTELNIINDNNSGEIFLKPISLLKEVFDLFVTTEQGFTYKLSLRPKIITSQQIFLKRTDFKLQNHAKSLYIRRENLTEDNLYFNFDEDFKIASINLIRHASNMNDLKEFTIVKRDRNILMYRDDLKVWWKYSYLKNDSSGISCEILYILNKSKSNIELKEEYFLINDIRVVKLDKQILKPQEGCFLYQIGGGIE